MRRRLFKRPLRWEKVRRCWFCKYRKTCVARIWWRGKFRKACPTCQIHYRQDTLKERR